ncbi:hypothetical protein [Microbacterium oxydans]|uniref:hypothetical protein n=1 Tax=Microbacterium oxydans TaxID=82380 RepID=UPI0037C895D0
MKWSAIVAAGFAVAAVGLIITAIALLIGQPLWGFVITALGLGIGMIGGAKYFAERN